MYFVEKIKEQKTGKHFDYFLFFAVVALSILGIIVLSSATLQMSNGRRIMQMQSIGLAVGIILSIVISFIDYKDFKSLGFILYLVSLGLLVLVLFIGIGEDQGSKSWLKFGGLSFQPSELGKIAFIIVSSVFFERIKEGNKGKNLVKLIVYSILPIALVLKQPDLGSASVFIFAFCMMAFICGIQYKYILIAFGAFVASLPILWLFVLQKYQKLRILVFLNPELDTKNRGYQVAQSKMAIGSGQLWGKGLYQGWQTQSGGIPVKESDFIFGVIGEELGFIGTIVMLVLVFAILLRCIYIAKHSRDSYGSFVVIGMASMLAFHCFENIGMCIGCMPATGIPLPFVSQGGSNMVTNYMAIGVILSVSMRRKRTIFNNSQ